MKKKIKSKVGIFTLNGYSNYGNRLQLFALTMVLNEFGFDTKAYWPKNLGRMKKFLIRNVFITNAKLRKERKLRRFTKRYLPKSSKCSDVDYSIVGSDQVWNPKWLPNSPYLLNVPNNSVKVSYAASMGVDTLTDAQKHLFEKYLRDYSAISVREKSAKKLLQPLTNITIETVLDPTLLLDVGIYKGLEKKPADVFEGENYVLCYILGNGEVLDYIKRFTAKKGFRIILFSDKSNSDYGVEEFLYLIHHAKLVCTDSFHACVFSFLYNRPFVVFRRTGGANYMYSRLQNFLDTFHLEEREFNGKDLKDDILTVDYSAGRRVLAAEQKKSLEYLKNALGVNNES